MAQNTNNAGANNSASRIPRSFQDGDDTATLINTSYADQALEAGGHISSRDDSAAQDASVPAAPPQANNTPAAANGEETVAGGGDADVVEGEEEGPVPVQAPPAAPAAPVQPPPAAPATAPAGGAAPVPRSGPYYRIDEVEQYEHAHSFFHRGKGRWAYGVPPDDAPPQTAVRGPGAEIWKAAHVGRNRR